MGASQAMGGGEYTQGWDTTQTTWLPRKFTSNPPLLVIDGSILTGLLVIADRSWGRPPQEESVPKQSAGGDLWPNQAPARVTFCCITKCISGLTDRFLVLQGRDHWC